MNERNKTRQKETGCTDKVEWVEERQKAFYASFL